MMPTKKYITHVTLWLSAPERHAGWLAFWGRLLELDCVLDNIYMCLGKLSTPSRSSGWYSMVVIRNHCWTLERLYTSSTKLGVGRKDVRKREPSYHLFLAMQLSHWGSRLEIARMSSQESPWQCYSDSAIVERRRKKKKQNECKLFELAISLLLTKPYEYLF